MLFGTHGCKQVRYSIPETSSHKTFHQRMGKARRSQEVVCVSVCVFHECLAVCLFCVYECLPAHMCVHHASEVRRGQSDPVEMGVVTDCKSPCGFWGPNLSYLQEQQVLLISDPSLQSMNGYIEFIVLIYS